MLKEPFRFGPELNLDADLGSVIPSHVWLLRQADEYYCLVSTPLPFPNTSPLMQLVKVLTESALVKAHPGLRHSSSRTPYTGQPPSTPQAQTDSPSSTAPSLSSTRPSPQSQGSVPYPHLAQLDESCRSASDLIQRTLLASFDVVRCSEKLAQPEQASAQLLGFQQHLLELAAHLTSLQRLCEQQTTQSDF